MVHFVNICSAFNWIYFYVDGHDTSRHVILKSHKERCGIDVLSVHIKLVRKAREKKCFSKRCDIVKI